MKKLMFILWLSVLVISAVSVSAEKPLFVMDDDSPVSDVILSNKLTTELKSQGMMTDEFQSSLNSEVTIEDLSNRVTVVIYNGQARIIVGSPSTTKHSTLAAKISDILKSQHNIDTGPAWSDSDLKSDDLKEVFSLVEEKEEKRGLFRRFWDWVKGLFS